MKLLSAGEIRVGMIIMGYEEVEEIATNIHMAYSDDFDSDLLDLPKMSLPTKRINLKPWYKGYPWKVISIAGPIVLVDSLGATIVKTKLTPNLIFDSRYTHFTEVTEEYYIKFWEHLGIKVELPTKTTEVIAKINNPAINQEKIESNNENNSILEEKMRIIKEWKNKFNYKQNFGSGDFELS